MSNFSKSNKTTGYYISSDDIKNLKIKVKFKEVNTTIPLPQFETFMSPDKPKDDINPSGYYDERIFEWQKKILSPAEIYHFIDKTKCTSDLEKKYNEIIGKNNLTPQNYTKKLFSYIEQDKYDNNYKLTTDMREYTNLVSEKLEGIHFEEHSGSNEGKVILESDLVTENHAKFILCNADNKSNSNQTMFVLVDMNNKESDPMHLLKREHVLFTLTWNPDNKSLSVSPDFNDITINPYSLEITYDSKQMFHYSIEQVIEDQLDEAKLAELDLLKKVAQSRKELRNRKLFRTFPMPPKQVVKCFYILGIVSADSFEYDNLYVEYTVELPYGFTSAEPLKGVTQISTTQGYHKTAHFNHLFELCAYYQVNIIGDGKDTLPPVPEIYFEVLSCDAWGRHRTEGYCHTKLPMMRPERLETNLQCVRPQGSDQRIWEMNRFFVGGRHLLDDITWIGTPSTFKESKLSKLGIKCISTGNLKISINALFQSQTFVMKKQANSTEPNVPIEHLSADSLFKSVNTVLRAYKHAKEKLISCQEGSGDT